MQHAIKTPPASEPVTLAEMRRHLGTCQSDDTVRDAVVTARIIAAREWAEKYLNRPIITQTWVAYGERFPRMVCHDKKGFIDLKKTLQSVTSVTYLDNNGNRQTLHPSLYKVSLVNHRISPAYNLTWPCAREDEESVQIEYVCGYGNAAAVPQSVKEAIMFIVSQWEVFQGGIEGAFRPMTVPYAAEQLLKPEIDMRHYFG